MSFGRHRLLAATLLLLAAPDLARAKDDELDAVVLGVIRANYQAIQGCYRKALASDRARGGTLFLGITVGGHDEVRAVRAARDELGSREATECVLGWARGWTLRGATEAGAEPGSEILVPLTFKSDPHQFAVHREDVPEVAAGNGVQIKALLTPRNAGADKAALELLRVAGTATLAARSGEQALYLLEGGGTLSSGDGKHRLVVRAGDAVAIPAGVAVSVAGPFEALHLVLPGPTAPAPTNEQAPAVARAAQARTLTVRGGALRVTPLLAQKELHHRRFYLGLIQARAGSAVPAHAHPGEAELIYIVAGRGTARAGDATAPVEAGHALYFGSGTSHSQEVAASLRAVQIFVPGGPEQRYLGGTRR